MINSTVEEIYEKAEDFAENEDLWHFHILTPECMLNNKNTYALVLENTSTNKSFVCYSGKPYMDAGKKLVRLLHGDDVIKDQSEKKKPPSKKVEKILTRARELSNEDVYWHHHMLFPGCMFNKHEGKWIILFEDMEEEVVIESVSEDEPKADLQHIEVLFYGQKS